MSEPYEELIEGERYVRLPPGELHEIICLKLYNEISKGLHQNSLVKLLPIRSPITYQKYTILKPDITLVTSKGDKIWLVIEIIDSNDHRVDTVIKKNVYEEMKPPRLWIVDPRFDNVEIYHQTPYGMALQHIYVNKEKLTDISLPHFEMPVYWLFTLT